MLKNFHLCVIWTEAINKNYSYFKQAGFRNMTQTELILVDINYFITWMISKS